MRTFPHCWPPPRSRHRKHGTSPKPPRPRRGTHHDRHRRCGRSGIPGCRAGHRADWWPDRAAVFRADALPFGVGGRGPAFRHGNCFGLSVRRWCGAPLRHWVKAFQRRSTAPDGAVRRGVYASVCRLSCSAPCSSGVGGVRAVSGSWCWRISARSSGLSRAPGSLCVSCDALCARRELVCSCAVDGVALGRASAVARGAVRGAQGSTAPMACGGHAGAGSLCRCGVSRSCAALAELGAGVGSDCCSSRVAAVTSAGSRGRTGCPWPEEGETGHAWSDCCGRGHQ